MKTFGCVTAIVLVCLAGAAQAELISNGSFTNGTTDWVVYGGAAAGTSSADGHDLVMSGAGSGTYQDMTWATLATGEQYTLSFDAGSLDASMTTGILLRLYPNGGSTIANSFTVGAAQLNTGWATYSTTWTMPASCNGKWPELEIDINTGTCAIDNVSLSKVPEPCALVMLATGLTGLLAYAWRKRK